MQKKIDTLSDWIQIQEEIPSPLIDLTEEVFQTTLETDFLLQASEQLQAAYHSLLGKLNVYS